MPLEDEEDWYKEFGCAGEQQVRSRQSLRAVYKDKEGGGIRKMHGQVDREAE